MAAQVVCDLRETPDPVATAAYPGHAGESAGSVATANAQSLRKPPVSIRFAAPPATEASRPGVEHRGPGLHVVSSRPSPMAEPSVPAIQPPAVRRVAVPPVSLPAELRRCEDLFFTFSFQDLVRRANTVIEQKSEFGDAYAFRCFALFGEVQLGILWEDELDLVELLRDYFDACERPMATEGGTVCRLFLKLLFGDLVRRIASAEPGSKFAIEKTDPLCSGAFAMLNGDFPRARQCFDAAALEPGTKAFALAGIGLLKLLHSDLAGAVGAFLTAGIADDDVMTLTGMLKR
jgi:hypothetical protein